MQRFYGFFAALLMLFSWTVCAQQIQEPAPGASQEEIDAFVASLPDDGDPLTTKIEYKNEYGADVIDVY